MMSEQYMISIDQSTQGTKALLFNSVGSLIWRVDQAHRQIIDEKGWVSHDPMEIYQNIIAVTARLLEEAGFEVMDEEHLQASLYDLLEGRRVGVGLSKPRKPSGCSDVYTPVSLAL